MTVPGEMPWALSEERRMGLGLREVALLFV